MDNLIIYALLDPTIKNVRYVGLSTRGKSRPERHLYPSTLKGKTHRENWLRKLHASGQRPIWFTLEVCDTLSSLSSAEKFWISHYRELGHPLTNHMDGGLDGLPDEYARAKMRAAQWKTYTTTPPTRAWHRVISS